MKLIKYSSLFCFSLFYLLFFSTSLANSPTISVLASQNPINLAPYMYYASQLEAENLQDVLEKRAEFKPFSDFSLMQETGSYWFLVDFAPMENMQASVAYLDIGQSLSKRSKVFILPRGVTVWESLNNVYNDAYDENIIHNNTIKDDLHISFSENNLYDLAPLRQGGTLLIHSVGIPNLWFSPRLELPAKACFALASY